MITCILLCNSCVKAKNSIKSDNPDELALLYGSQALNAVIESKIDKDIKIHIGSNVQEWSILRVFPFTSERKRMSVIAENKSSHKVYLFMKVSI